jgi:hypothetical protein
MTLVPLTGDIRFSVYRSYSSVLIDGKQLEVIRKIRGVTQHSPLLNEALSIIAWLQKKAPQLRGCFVLN